MFTVLSNPQQTYWYSSCELHRTRHTVKLTQQSVTDVLSIAQVDLPGLHLKKGYNHTFVRNDDGILG